MAHNWAHKQQENASELWNIITQRSRRDMPTQEMGALNRAGHETMQALGTYGEAIDWTNKQVSIGKGLESNPFTYNISKQLRQSKVGAAILDFSYHDARQGAVKWIGGKNQAAGVAANILLPDAMDFIGGVGYADNVIKAANKYGPDLIGRLKNIPNAQAILKRGGQEANKLLDEASQGLRNIVDPNASRALAPAGGPNVLRATTEMPPGGMPRQGRGGMRTTDLETGRLKGQQQQDIFRKAVLSGDDKAIAKSLDTEFAGALDSKYIDGRRGFYNQKRLVGDKELLKRIVEKQDVIGQAHFKYMKDPDNINYQRELFEAIGDTYFNDGLLVYGGKSGPFRKALADGTKWLTGDEWHHIFGNREAGEFLMSAVARDPLVGVNLARLLKKHNLTAAGVTDNLMVMKALGHNNFHRFLKKIGVDPAGKTRGVADLGDFGQAIADMATKGHKYGPKVVDPVTGVSLAGKIIPPDPTYVNELFGMIEVYAKANKRFVEILRQGGVWVDPKLKRIVPKGTAGAKYYDFTANAKGEAMNPELLADKIGRVLKALESFEDLPLTLPKV